MQALETIFGAGQSGVLVIAALALLLGGGAAVAWPLLAGRAERGHVKRRLRVETPVSGPAAPAQKRREGNEISERALKTAQEFYARTDPENVARLRMKLIQAGYMDPRAVGLFFLIRFGAFFGVAIAALVACELAAVDLPTTNRWVFALIAGVLGYFAPGFVLSRRVSAKMTEYRNGFPDFMDLMIVCADAGMSMEASIERVARELAHTYPSLSQNLQLVSIELRAGRSLDDALKALGERLTLDEVRSFATLLQQSRELGTSLSGALRVFSDEMRHKRMALAEEKAHALPAKMSVPVTVCILPVVLLIAIIPIIVKFSVGP